MAVKKKVKPLPVEDALDLVTDWILAVDVPTKKDIERKLRVLKAEEEANG